MACRCQVQYNKQMNLEDKRICLLTTTHTYRSDAFTHAAEKLGIELILVFDMPTALGGQGKNALGVNFKQPETAVATILAFAQIRPFSAIIPVDDSGVYIAAKVSAALNLPHNNPISAEAARDKLRMRQLLAKSQVPVPAFTEFNLDEDIESIKAIVQEKIGYPCVVKPRTLNGSRGVIRANNGEELTAVMQRVNALLHAIGGTGILVEAYMPGVEVALEGVLNHGKLQILALFDKPDPLEGPFFEETIYVTPSRLPTQTQAAIAKMAEQGAAALGLQTGSVHAELRINNDGVWIVEVNGRSIGGLCSQTLRFDMDMSLEELLLRQAIGLDVTIHNREQQASGVMMIPIPKAGILRGYSGVEDATSIEGIDKITITAPLHNRLVLLPEGESYLGFIFASGETPAYVEDALRRAHQKLQFQIDEEIPLQIKM